MSHLHPAEILSLFTEKMYPIADLSLEDIQQLKEQQNKIWIFYQTDSPELPDGERDLLAKILKAVHLSLKQIQLVNVHTAAITKFKYLKKYGKVEHIVGFGISPKALQLNFQMPFYQLANFKDCQFLFAHALHEIATDNVKKKLLWNSLKGMFL